MAPMPTLVIMLKCLIFFILVSTVGFVSGEKRAPKASLINPYIYGLDSYKDFVLAANAPFVCQSLQSYPIPEDLDFESKYVQTEKTKSTLKKDLGAETTTIKNQILDFFHQVSALSDGAVYAENQTERLIHLNCLFDTLSAWAEEGALLNVIASDSGRGTRKWFLSAIASNLLKTKAAYKKFVLPENVKQWLNRLAVEVQKDYAYRLFAKPHAINNHDYWAAWAVACVAILLNKPHYLSYADKVFDVALQQITLDKAGDYGYLPNEVKRGKLAVEYTHFALVPLLYLADLFSKNGDKPHGIEALKPLARFAFDGVQSESSVVHIIGKDQQAIEPKRWTWVFPYVALVKDKEDALKLAIQENSEWLTVYPLVGGDITAFYPVDKMSLMMMPANDLTSP